MGLSGSDWIFVAVPLLVVGWLAWRVAGLARSPAAYLAGGRAAGRYLLTVADGMAGFGLAAVLAGLEYTSACGFGVNFWGAVAVPVSVVLAVTGFAVYRYRETRALTLGQFLEMRYGRGVRIAAAALGWVSAFAGYAMFPAVAARFVVAYCGLPPVVEVAGLELPSHGLLAALFLALALVLVLAGGQVAALATDALQGIFVYVGSAVVVAAVLLAFPLSQFREAMLAQPPGRSFVDPFDVGGFTEFNVLFILLGIVGGIYNRLSQPLAQASLASAASPHEQKMAGILAVWRSGLVFQMVMLLGLAVFTIHHHPSWAEEAARVQAAGGGMPEKLALTVRVALPEGVEGVFLAVMLFLMLTTDTTNLHALGATFAQDVLLPWRRVGPGTRVQLRLLRAAVALSAVGVLAVAMVFEQRAPLYMAMALAGALYLSFAGALFLGGLYWRRGTAQGAWAAMVAGGVLASISFSLTWHWRDVYFPWLAAHAPGILDTLGTILAFLSAAVPIAAWELSAERFPFSGAELAFGCSVACCLVYALVSLLTCGRPFDLDRLLNRGPSSSRAEPENGWKGLLVKMGCFVDAEFTRGDRILAWSAVGWAALSFAVFLVVTTANLIFGRWGAEGFFEYWKWWTLGSGLLIGSITAVWFAWGAARDLGRFLRVLETLGQDSADDGLSGRPPPGE